VSEPNLIVATFFAIELDAELAHPHHPTASEAHAHLFSPVQLQRQ
jgi:hypothetical protein